MTAPADHERLHAAMNELTVAAELPAETKGQPGKFRTATVIWTVLTLVCAAMMFAGDTGVILGAVFGVMCVIVTIAFVAIDLGIPAARDRGTSAKAVNSYFKGVAKGRWDTAFAALSPMARDMSVRVPLIEDLQTIPANFVRNSPKQLKCYWKTILKPGGKLNRRLNKLKVVQVSGSGNVHRHRVDMNVEYYPSWIVISILLGVLPAILIIWATRKTYKTSFEVVSFRYKSQWWMLTGELASPAEGNNPDARPLPVAKVVR
jgi:hypothetical protein